MQKIKFYNLITSDSAALLYFFIFWTSLLGFTKTPFSGIHFQDDHQIITINKELSSDKVIDVISSHVKEDLKIRLRPFYFVHRVLITKILRDNIIYWSLYTGLLAILASFFLYKFIRLLQFSSIESILFVFLTLLGPHTCIWWRLGNAETIGTVMLAMSLFFISKAINSPNYSSVYKILSIITITFSLLSKESYILFIPAIILLYLFFSTRIHKVSYQTIFKKNRLFIFILFILFILPLIFVLHNLITNTISYAGISNNYFSLNFIKWAIVQFYKNIYFFIIIFGFFLIIQNTPVTNFNNLIKQSLKSFADHAFIIIIFLAIFVPQCFLYFKSGMIPRYFIPLVFGFSILIIYLLNILTSDSTISYTSKFSFLTFIIIAIIYINFKIVVPSANKFSEEGLQTGSFISNIVNHSDRKDKILFVIDPGSEYEWGFFLKSYFEIELNRDNIYFLPVSSVYSYRPNYISKDLFIKKFDKYIIKPDDLIIEKFTCIAILPLSKNVFLKEFPAFTTSSEYVSLE